MSTAFSQDRMDFTKRAHLAAQKQFYAPMFPDVPIAFEDTVNTIRDLEYAIDCRLAVTVAGLRAPLYFAIQERWREPKEMHWGDVTVTEWNSATNLPSELHKLGAQLFVYGFYDKTRDRVLAAAAIDIPVVLRSLALGQANYKRQSRVDQTFLGFDIRNLRRLGAVMYEADNRHRCITCSTIEERWDARHPLYREGAAQCPYCAQADVDEWPEVAEPGGGIGHRGAA